MPSASYRFASSRFVSRATHRLVRRPTSVGPLGVVRRIATVRVREHPKQVLLLGDLALVACMAGSLDVVDVVSATRVASLPLPGMAVDIVAKSGHVVYVSVMRKHPTRSGMVVAVDLSSVRALGVVTLDAGWAKGMALRPGTDELWVTTWLSGAVAVVDTLALSSVASVSCGVATRGVAFDEDGYIAYVTDYYGRTVAVLDAGTRAVVGYVPLPYQGLAYKGNPRDVVVMPGGTILVSNMGRGVVHRLERYRTETAKVAVGNRPATLRMLDDRQTVVSVAHGNGELWGIDANSMSIVGHWPVRGKTYGFDVRGMGTPAVVGRFDEACIDVVELQWPR